MPISKINEGPFDRFASRFGRIIDPEHFLGRSAFDIPWDVSYPPTNVRRDSEAYHIDLLVPGFERDELEVMVVKGELIIKGTKEEKVPVTDKEFIQAEFDIESFERKFKLTTAHSDNRIEAFLDNGILRIVFYVKHDPVVSEFKRIPVTEKE